MTQNKTYQRLLLRRLRELGVRLQDIEAELITHADPDWDDMAIEREGDEVLEHLGTAGQAEIAQIRAALKRMADGKYGQCVSCGETISADRLEVLPATPFCRVCAKEKSE